ncbi:MAG: crossover junction endodeoxyribonuclease RuvC [Bacteroidales bacterium]
MGEDKVILGIDPGTSIMGYGVIHCLGKTPHFKDMGVIDMRKTGDVYEKLGIIYQKTTELLSTYLPDEVALEAPFFGKNVQSMLKLGRAQGVAIAAILARKIPAFEYAPRKVKQSITGAGDASKEQVAHLLMRQFGLREMPRNLDATDGLAVALCHFYQNGLPVKSGGPKKWEDFVRRNPGRVRGD